MRNGATSRFQASHCLQAIGVTSACGAAASVAARTRSNMRAPCVGRAAIIQRPRVANRATRGLFGDRSDRLEPAVFVFGRAGEEAEEEFLHALRDRAGLPRA